MYIGLFECTYDSFDEYRSRLTFTGLFWFTQVSFDFFSGVRIEVQYTIRLSLSWSSFFSGVFLSYIGLFWFLVGRVRCGVRGAACRVRMSAYEISYALFTSRMNVSRLMWMCHVSYKCVMSHMNVSCLTWMCHVSHECVMSHMNESDLICIIHVAYECVTSHVNVSCLI